MLWTRRLQWQQHTEPSNEIMDWTVGWKGLGSLFFVGLGRESRCLRPTISHAEWIQSFVLFCFVLFWLHVPRILFCFETKKSQGPLSRRKIGNVSTHARTQFDCNCINLVGWTTGNLLIVKTKVVVGMHGLRKPVAMTRNTKSRIRRRLRRFASNNKTMGNSIVA